MYLKIEPVVWATAWLTKGAFKDKCHAVDKAETIKALKNNNREAIGEIQL